MGQDTGRREILGPFGAAALQSLPAAGSAGQGARPVLEAGGRVGKVHGAEGRNGVGRAGGVQGRREEKLSFL